jgi:hypothetical protein
METALGMPPRPSTTGLDVLLTKLVAGEPAIVVHPRCSTLVRGLAGDYRFKSVAWGRDCYVSSPLFRLGEEIFVGRQHLPLIRARLEGAVP